MIGKNIVFKGEKPYALIDNRPTVATGTITEQHGDQVVIDVEGQSITTYQQRIHYWGDNYWIDACWLPRARGATNAKTNHV